MTQAVDSSHPLSACVARSELPAGARILLVDWRGEDSSEVRGPVCAQFPDLQIEWAGPATAPAQLSGRFAYCAMLVDVGDLQQRRCVQAIAAIRNLHCAHIDVLVAAASGTSLDPAQERALLALGFRARAPEDAFGKITGWIAYRYELERYNRKRRWNSPENWANPENFHRYRW